MTLPADGPPRSTSYRRLARSWQLVEEDGKVIGLVTTTDAFEAIAGELEDPLDEERE